MLKLGVVRLIFLTSLINASVGLEFGDPGRLSWSELFDLIK